MKSFREYWTFSAIRGSLTILAAIAILAVPRATSFMLSLPLLVTLAIDCFATYSIFDAAAIVLLAKLLPEGNRGGRVLYAQVAMQLATGALLFSVTYQLMDLKWVMIIAAAQAAFGAVVEWKVARTTHRQYGCLSCYSSSITLAVSALFLPFTARLDALDMSLALGTYVGLYGSAELLLGARMLFVEYRAEHPAAVASEAWRSELAPAPLATTREPMFHILNACATCPADHQCGDYTFVGQVAKVVAQREPAIVRSVRIKTMFEELATAHSR